MKKIILMALAILLMASTSWAESITVQWSNSYPVDTVVTIEGRDVTLPDFTVLGTVPGNITTWTGELPYSTGTEYEIRSMATTKNTPSPYSYTIRDRVKEKAPVGFNKN